MNDLQSITPSLFVAARVTGGVGLLIGLLGLIFAGGHAGIDLVIYVGSTALSTFAPKWFFLRPRTRGVLFVALVLGFISPILVALEEWPTSANWVQVVQCAPLILFMFVLVRTGK